VMDDIGGILQLERQQKIANWWVGRGCVFLTGEHTMLYWMNCQNTPRAQALVRRSITSPPDQTTTDQCE
jgi:hypothetical protein